MASELAPAGTPETQGIGDDPLFFYTRVYLIFLQGLFKQMPAGSYAWSSDLAKTEIVITDQAPYPMAKNEFKPGIVVMRGPAQFASLTLDNLVNVDPRTGKKTYKDLVAMTMSINCTARLGLEAQRIAWIVARHINIFRKLLQKSGGFHLVNSNISVGPESPPGSIVAAEADSEAVMVTVQSPVFFQYDETVVPLDAPLLKHMEENLVVRDPPANLADSDLREFRLRPPSMRGQLITGESIPLDSVPVKQTVRT